MKINKVSYSTPEIELSLIMLTIQEISLIFNKSTLLLMSKLTRVAAAEDCNDPQIMGSASAFLKQRSFIHNSALIRLGASSNERSKCFLLATHLSDSSK
ncbi:hypothetical protein CDAR_303541 [Caerostris darwini]|uniref:Uncharacterized protein n=1 Tax=Caerostris darwini TaxID=1538125 RepID=A0AAV4WWW9_9ARAC|nr:hypothetical protein CDAR_303541 [Caerostris darwini]